MRSHVMSAGEQTERRHTGAVNTHHVCRELLVAGLVRFVKQRKDKIEAREQCCRHLDILSD